MSPSGNDAAAGSESDPLASMAGARNRIRAIKSQGILTTPVTVYFADGVYEVAEPVVFTSGDSGGEAAQITYKALNPGKVTISGGRAITGWTQREPGVWAAPVQGGHEFYQLFVNGGRRQRARIPNQGYLKSFGPTKTITNFNELKPQDLKHRKEFRYRGDDFQEWADLSEALVIYYHSWIASLHWVDRLDTEQGIVYLRNPSGWPLGKWDNQQQRFVIEGVRAAFDAPGEWYLDKAAGELLYRPLSGEVMAEAEVVAPVAQRLLEFEDVEHLAFEGLSFRYSDWRLDKDNYRDQQAFANIASAVIFARKLRNTRFERCEIAFAGAHAMMLREGCQGNIIRQCHIHNMAGGGVYIGVTTPVLPGTPAGMLSNSNVVDNCFIHDLNHTFHGAAGILVAHASDNLITHNDISEFDYTGISAGWIWTLDHRTNHRRNVIEKNRVHHLIKGVLSDGGGIYTTGYYNEGTVIRGNVVHDIHHHPTHNHAKGIYLDGCSSDILVENNLCYDISGLGIQTKGERNVVRNNIFAFCGMAGLSRGRQVDAVQMTTFEPNVFSRNIVYLEDAPVASGQLLPDMSELDYQLYWNRTPPGEVTINFWTGLWPVTGTPLSLDEFRAQGQDKHSVIANPHFVNSNLRDFRLARKSPAREIGFVPFDYSDAGLYGDAAWRGLPATLVHRPLEAVETDWLEFSHDFEDHRAGMHPMTCWYPGERGSATVRISDQRAYSGSKSVVFESSDDAPSFFPSLTVVQPYPAGRYRLSMRLWNDPVSPASISIQTRSYEGREFLTGVQVELRPDGTMRAGGQRRDEVPSGEWVQLEMTFGSGAEHSETYDVKLTRADGSTLLCGSVAVRDAGFEEIGWIGIIANGQTGRFHMDDLELKGVEE